MTVSLDSKSLEAIARRIAREPVYSEYADCSQAIADRRALFDHILWLEASLRVLERAYAIADATLEDAAERFDPIAFVRQEDDADAAGDVHVFPLHGRPHVLSGTGCWCKPQVEDLDGEA